MCVAGAVFEERDTSLQDEPWMPPLRQANAGKGVTWMLCHSNCIWLFQVTILQAIVGKEMTWIRCPTNCVCVCVCVCVSLCTRTCMWGVRAQIAVVITSSKMQCRWPCLSSPTPWVLPFVSSSSSSNSSIGVAAVVVVVVVAAVALFDRAHGVCEGLCHSHCT